MDELIEQVRQGYLAYRAEHGHSPSVRQLADYLDLTRAETAAALAELEAAGVLRRWPGIERGETPVSSP